MKEIKHMLYFIAGNLFLFSAIFESQTRWFAIVLMSISYYAFIDNIIKSWNSEKEKWTKKKH